MSTNSRPRPKFATSVLAPFTFLYTVFLVCLTFFLFAFTASVWASPPNVGRSQHTEARLLSRSVDIQPGHLLHLGLLLKMDPGWHTYWINPGDAGMSTRIDWQLPEGFSAGSIQWPTPRRLASGPLMSYGYSDEVLLLNLIQVPAQLKPEQSVRIKAQVSWLECKVICLPGRAELSMVLPTGRRTSGERPGKWLSHFQKAELSLPRPYPKKETQKGAYFYSHPQINTIELWIPLSDRVPLKQDDVYFFPQRPGEILHAKPQKIERSDSGLKLLLEREPNSKTIESLRGVLFLGMGANALAIEAQARHSSFPSQAGGLSVFLPGILSAILLAFLGGLVLNLMPCVLPVLSIKVLHLLPQREAPWSRRLFTGLSYGGGVLFSFWLLAGILWLLRAKGETVGWGFQLQSPGFVFFISLFLFGFALNLLGVFEIGLSLTRLSSAEGLLQKKERDGQKSSQHLLASFFSGCLATVVATPCTAPFMGTALGYALVQPVFGVAFLVFSSLGIGMAAPFVLLSVFPALLRFVPRTGPWMEDLRKCLGFILIGSVIWFLWVLARISSQEHLVQALVCALILALGAWIYGRWSQPGVSSRIRLIARGGACVLLLTAFAPVFWEREAEAPGIVWETYSPEQAAALHKSGQTVLVNFTADWCLSCKVNEALVFADSEVQKNLRLQNVATLKADWTRYDPVITQALASYGRSGVPVYVLLHKAKAEALLLPEILTKNTFLKALNLEQ